MLFDYFTHKREKLARNFHECLTRQDIISHVKQPLNLKQGANSHERRACALKSRRIKIQKLFHNPRLKKENTPTKVKKK